MSEFDSQIDYAAKILKAGGVIVCPTEGIYGISCLYNNDAAIQRVIDVKRRSPKKGLIVVAASYKMAMPLLDLSKISKTHLEDMIKSWPGHHTWVVPCSKIVSKELTGGRNSIAIRVTPYLLLQDLCIKAGGPLVSTSANISGEAPISSLSTLHALFDGEVDYILEAPCQGAQGSSTIHDAMTGAILRQGGK